MIVQVSSSGADNGSLLRGGLLLSSGQRSKQLFLQV
jgi:hypothetical protein